MSEVHNIIGQDERILEVDRRHWINTAPLFGAWFVTGMAALFGFYFLGRYWPEMSARGIGGSLAAILVCVLVLSLLLGYVGLWVYKENRIIITDKNLYQVTQNSLFSRSISQFNLERMQDVAAVQSGFLPTILDYGDVRVETAGEEENFVFKQAPHPGEIAAKIMECHKLANAQTSKSLNNP